MSFIGRIIQIKDTFFEKYWLDPVWSKVISVIIITVGGSFLTTLYIIIKSIYNKVSFESGFNQVVLYFKSSTEINNFILWISTLIISWYFFLFFKSIFLKVKLSRATTGFKDLPLLYDHSTVFFSQRLASAFPGQRGLEWYDAKTAVERLKIVFRDPIDFKADIKSSVPSDPVWWYRGFRAMFIKEIKVLSKTKILLGVDELEINRMAVFITPAYYKCFIYIETKAEQQTGLYNILDEDIKSHIELFGYSWEEFALFKKKAIKREDYDDKATIINKKVVDAFEAKLRVRFLSKYNFIIAAKESPYNSRKFNNESLDYFNDILQGKQTAEILFDYLNTFNKYEQ